MLMEFEIVMEMFNRLWMHLNGNYGNYGMHLNWMDIIMSVNKCLIWELRCLSWMVLKWIVGL